MFTKLLFVVVLGCALVLASPAHDENSSSVRVARQTTKEKIAQWVDGVETKISNFFGKVGEAFTKLWRRITGKDSKEKQEKLNEIKRQYEVTKEESVAAVQAKKSEWDRIIEENEQKLQQLRQEADVAVENEMKAWDEKFEQLKEEAEVVINSK